MNSYIGNVNAVNKQVALPRVLRMHSAHVHSLPIRCNSEQVGNQAVSPTFFFLC